jgi:hypothetical protein
MATLGPRLRTALVCVLAVVLGAVAGFFTAGPALFADGAMQERIVAVAISVAIYFVLGMGVGSLRPRAWRLVACCLYVPLLAVLALFGGEALDTVQFSLLVVGFALGDLAAALSGSLVGSRLRAGRAS